MHGKHSRCSTETFCLIIICAALIIGIIFCIALTAHAASIRGASGAAAVDCSKLVDGKVPESCKKSEAAASGAASGATGIPEPTWGPKKVLKTTNYLDVDPQDYGKITVARETAANATQAKNLRNLMLEDRKSDCVGTGRDCNLDNHEQVDQDKTKREEMKTISSGEVVVKSNPSHQSNDDVLQDNFFKLFRGTNPQIEKESCH